MVSQNLDDMLLNQITGTEPPRAVDVPRETPEDPPTEVPVVKVEAKVDQVTPEKPSETNEYGDAAKPAPEPEKAESTDDYGLGVEDTKTYSKAEMNEYANRIVRERLARLERNSGQQQQVQSQQTSQTQTPQQGQGFQYDENSNLDWQQQLEQFVFQAADKREHMRAQQIQQAQEQQRMAEFEGKFKQGMEKFNDYHDVVGGKEITDAMVMGARGIKDPASFFYAAAKRAPEELAKIAREPDPYAQAAAIGRLDATLRKQANKISNAPKPVSQTKTDMVGTPKSSSKSNHSELDQMLLADQAKRLELVRSRRR